jgi:hypothetical protein
MSKTAFRRSLGLVTRSLSLLPLLAIGLLCGGKLAVAEAPTTCRLVSTEGQTRDCLHGRWHLTAVSTAPWVKLEIPKRLLHDKEIIFENGAMMSNALFPCEKAQQSLVQMERAGLFEGNLPNEGKDSNVEAQLGLDKGGRGTPTVRIHCENGSYDFHIASDDVFILAYINVIYRAVRLRP